MEIKSRDSGIDRQNLDSTDSLDGEFGYSQMLDSTLKRIYSFPVWTERQDAAHLISCRYADKQQTQRYFTIVQP